MHFAAHRCALAPLVFALLLPAPPLFAAEDGWPTAAPEAVGLAPDLAPRLDAALAGEGMENMHALLVARDGKLVYERYLTGDDEKLDWKVHDVVFGPETKHDLRSITKSVVGLLYGIALGEGKVPGLDAPLMDSFPEYADLAGDPLRQRITIGNALSMTMGTEWSESGDGPNSEGLMEHSADMYRYALAVPMAAEPGATWTYNGGATALLAAIIARGAGMSLIDYADARLFGPLGIEDVDWFTDYYGVAQPFAGLRLRPRDVAKIGQLVLQDGMWNGVQVVPADWLAASFRRGVTAEEGCDYGYQWWLCATESGLDVREGAGNGGQELLIVPDLDLVVVTTRGSYGDPDAWEAPWALLEEVVAGAQPK
ncbi:serine hydrolase [Amaricoccus sp.]|uniref:serine hydrolase domain-containing protein n=1 Tax=Amaricoccus sp. TaxID=1872485 RepID=UPI001B65BC0B|nr:serine hydrolase [Amaricoccus sp.]MBP7002926.1 serine hydrolase [Amaricoccus sp.]